MELTLRHRDVCHLTSGGPMAPWMPELQLFWAIWTLYRSIDYDAVVGLHFYDKISRVILWRQLQRHIDIDVVHIDWYPDTTNTIHYCVSTALLIEHSIGRITFKSVSTMYRQLEVIRNIDNRLKSLTQGYLWIFNGQITDARLLLVAETPVSTGETVKTLLGPCFYEWNKSNQTCMRRGVDHEMDSARHTMSEWIGVREKQQTADSWKVQLINEGSHHVVSNDHSD